MNKENRQPKLSVRTLEPAPAPARAPTSPTNYHNTYMKYLISSNAEYFSNKLRTNQSARPKDIRFKIPCRTGHTIYKRDYPRQYNQYKGAEPPRQDMSVDCIKTNNFLKDEPEKLRMCDKTTYQQEFKYYPIKTEHTKKLKRRVDTIESDDQTVPRFFDTQNRADFLNWAGKNYVASMKPADRPATTNAPFEGTSVYRADFEGKCVARTPLFVRESSFPKFGSASMIMKTQYSNQYGPKVGGKQEIDCRPRYYQATLCKQFKGKTEYKRQFKGAKRQEEEAMPLQRTVQQLQTLIIDL